MLSETHSLFAVSATRTWRKCWSRPAARTSVFTSGTSAYWFETFSCAPFRARQKLVGRWNHFAAGFDGRTRGALLAEIKR